VETERPYELTKCVQQATFCPANETRCPVVLTVCFPGYNAPGGALAPFGAIVPRVVAAEIPSRR